VYKVVDKIAREKLAEICETLPYTLCVRVYPPSPGGLSAPDHSRRHPGMKVIAFWHGLFHYDRLVAVDNAKGFLMDFLIEKLKEVSKLTEVSAWE
jgi:hypothetical protein